MERQDQMGENNIGMLAVGNSMFAVLQNYIARLEPTMHLLLTACQITVAVVTVLYVIKKMKALPKRRRKRKAK